MTSADALDAAHEAGLRYVSDHRPGIRRVRRGRGFSYIRPNGSLITDERERARIAGIAIPPAWTDVWISPWPDGHVLATGRDARGRKQYRYHPRWREVRDATKYDRMLAFGELLPTLRRRVDEDLSSRGLGEARVMAAVIRLLDQTLVRIGNEEYATDNESFGLTTITAEHVEVTGSSIRLQFRGKGGAWHEASLDDRRLARVVKGCEELPGQDLFTYVGEGGVPVDVTSTGVNEYLRGLSGEDITAKDFRTWGGTVMTARALAGLGPAETSRTVDRNLLAAIDVAAEVLGNSRTVCRNCYVHPAVGEAYRDGALLVAWRTARRAGGLGRAERTVLKVLRDGAVR